MRELVNVRIKVISKKDFDDPYNEGQKQKYILLILPSTDDEGKPEEDRIYVNTRSPWLKTVRMGDNVPMVKEWSNNKVNKKTEEKGAYAYRPILIKCHLESPGPSQPDLSGLKTVQHFLRWLIREIKGEAPMRRLIEHLVSSEVITREEGYSAGKDLMESGKIVAELLNPPNPK